MRTGKALSTYNTLARDGDGDFATVSPFVCDKNHRHRRPTWTFITSFMKDGNAIGDMENLTQG
jgi:hypothetical protein